MIEDRTGTEASRRSARMSAINRDRAIKKKISKELLMPYKKDSTDVMTKPSWMQTYGPIEYLQVKADMMLEKIALRYLKRVYTLMARGTYRIDSKGQKVWSPPGARELAEGRECLKLAKIDLTSIKRLSQADDADSIREEIRLKLSNAGTDTRQQSAAGA
jgi:hypothetical protein